MKIVAAILAGGKASRLGGIAKGLLSDAADVSWIERLIKELAKAGVSEVVISANEPQPCARFGKTIVSDLHPHAGPLGGIEAVLQHLAGQCDAVLFVPCDLPNFSAAEMLALIEAHASAYSATGTQRIVMAETPGREHPLCAVVPTAMLADVSAAIERGDLSVVRLWKSVGAVAVRIENPGRLVNINTHEELLHWRQTAE